jgi:hypothetical protein
MDCIEYIYEPNDLVSDDESEAEHVDMLALVVSGIAGIFVYLRPEAQHTNVLQTT